ncbi:hypothetical protein LTR66_000033 [Elasticomyces elasticus]|nr:hypothetical protein LTR66_000033 [Elasticomyces elasticus]
MKTTWDQDWDWAAITHIGRNHEHTSSVWVGAVQALLLALAMLAVCTRSISAYHGSSKKESKSDATTVPLLPYWLPILGHLPNMALMPDKLLRGARSGFPSGIFALNFGGTTHNIIFSPSLGTALLGQKPAIAAHEQVSKYMMNAVFGFPKSQFVRYDAAVEEILKAYRLLLSEPYLGQLVATTASTLKESVRDWVTGSRSVVDQMLWERNAGAESVISDTGETTVEASLLTLTRDFIGSVASPSLFGTAFVSNNPEILSDLWTLDSGFLLIATGLPRWLPIPRLTRAHIARQRLLRAIETFEMAMDKDADGEDVAIEYGDLSDVSQLIRTRVGIYRKHGFNVRARAACELALMWATNANANALVFWMLNRIYADKALLAMVRKEIEPYVKAVRPRMEFPIAEPTRLETFDVDALNSKCPLLKSCYIECLRLDCAPWSLKKVEQDFVLQDRDKNSQGAWLLRKGSYAHVAHDLHSTDPRYFDSPDEWRAHRHIKLDEKGERSADMGTIRPYGGGSSMCKGRAFAQRECLMFTAAIVAMWDVEPARGREQWEMPRPKKATGVYATKDDVRVRISRRKLPTEL